jgi:hypothetical protein
LKITLLGTAMSVSMLLVCATAGFSATELTYLEKRSGWDSCSVCAGTDGNGDYTPHSMTKNVSSPTRGAKSAHFSISGSNSYGDALWWNTLGSGVSSTNFVYDVYLYLKNPSASRALEFDVVETSHGRHITFATQCNFSAHVFRVYSNTAHWVDTAIACHTLTAYKWNHLTLEFHRTSGGNAQFVSMTLNGTKHYFNKTESGKSSSGNTTNVSFQMDQNKSASDYSVWMENLSLKHW